MTVIYRVQDAEGRGPWRPGFSHLWVRPRADLRLRPWFVEWPGLDREFLPGWHIGCGCLTAAQLRRWFNAEEYLRLVALGYGAVSMGEAVVIRSGPTQVVFRRALPLAVGVRPVLLYGLPS